MNFRKLLASLSRDASRMHFLANDEVAMGKSEWMNREFQMQVRNAEMMGCIHKSADVHGSWWQTPICPIAKLSALALLSCSGGQTIYYWISDPTRGAEMIKSSQIKIKSWALLQWKKKRCHMPASEYFRDYRCLGMEFQWLERQRDDCLNALPVNPVYPFAKELMKLRQKELLLNNPTSTI